MDGRKVIAGFLIRKRIDNKQGLLKDLLKEYNLSKEEYERIEL